MIRRSNNASESWKNLPWKQFRRNLFRLQKRVYKAVQVGDMHKAKSIQKLILKSTAARLLAVRQVSQLNAGKKTAGIDGKKDLTFEERFELSEELERHGNNWHHQGLREVPIPKKNGTIRILKIPTLGDRAWQCLAKYALEPACALQPSMLGATGSDQGEVRMTHKSSSSLTCNPIIME
jgi:retron-type reverse transcriptase